MRKIGSGACLLRPLVRKETNWRARRFALAAVVVVLANLFACDHKYAPPCAFSTLSGEQAAQIMAQVVAAYHSVPSYSDTGTIVDRAGRGGFEMKVRFETFFKRPSKLRFNWTIENNNVRRHRHNAMIRSDGTTTWTSYSFRGSRPERKDSLDLAVAGAIGASLGSAHRIPRLLIDQITSFRMDELKDLRIRSYEPADEVECVVLVGERAVGTEVTVWVGRQDHLIRRIEERSRHDVLVETRTRILVNQDIPDSRFGEQER
jgi:outer membrane lipoprotein-sorting protein